LSPGRVGYRASDLAAWLDQRRMGASLDAYAPNLRSRIPQRPTEHTESEVVEAVPPELPKRGRGRPRKEAEAPAVAGAAR
jgi:hypothetical protein